MHSSWHSSSSLSSSSTTSNSSLRTGLQEQHQQQQPPGISRRDVVTSRRSCQGECGVNVQLCEASLPGQLH